MRASKKPRNNPPSQVSRSDEGPTLTSIIRQEHHWEGPLPPPQTIREFQEMVPDAAERIFRQWEEESAHRRSYENSALDGAIRKDRRGQHSAIAFALGALGLAGYAVYLDQPWVAGVIGGGTIASVVGAFLYQRQK